MISNNNNQSLNFEIIKLPVSDWKEYKSLRLEALKTDQQAFAKPYRVEDECPDEKWQNRMDQVDKGDSWLFFAQDTATKELFGMAGGYRDKDDLINHSAQIWGVFVRPDYRGKGVAKSLISRILNEFEKNSDISKAILEVNVDQQSAKKLYEKLGFTVINTFICTLGDGAKHEVSIMEKELRK